MFTKVKLIFLLLFCGKYGYCFNNLCNYIYQNKSNSKQLIGNLKLSSCFKDGIFDHLVCFGSENDQNIAVHDVNNEINYKNIKFYISPSKLMHLRKKPHCFTVRKINKTIIKAFGYIKHHQGLTTKTIYFFTDNKLFMVEKVIPENHKFLLDSYFDKYIHEQYELTGKNTISGNLLIKGKNNSFICIEDNGFDIVLKYYSKADQQINNKIEDALAIVFRNVEKNNRYERLIKEII